MTLVFHAQQEKLTNKCFDTAPTWSTHSHSQVEHLRQSNSLYLFCGTPVP